MPGHVRLIEWLGPSVAKSWADEKEEPKRFASEPKVDMKSGGMRRNLTRGQERAPDADPSESHRLRAGGKA